MRLRQIISWSFIPTMYVLLVLLLEMIEESFAQSPEPLFELPVQLVGFPVIVLSVRLSQFAKKLAYSLNPNTYRSRSKRDTAALIYDAELAQKAILREFGPKACILEEPCRVHASRNYPEMGHAGTSHIHPPWNEVLSNYKVQSTGLKQWYLLSLFIGDAVRDVPLCKHLAKRMPCPGQQLQQQQQHHQQQYQVHSKQQLRKDLGPLPPPQPR